MRPHGTTTVLTGGFRGTTSSRTRPVTRGKTRLVHGETGPKKDEKKGQGELEERKLIKGKNEATKREGKGGKVVIEGEKNGNEKRKEKEGKGGEEKK